MGNEVMRYGDIRDLCTRIAECGGLSQLMRGGLFSRWVATVTPQVLTEIIDDYDALRAEAEALRAELSRRDALDADGLEFRKELIQQRDDARTELGAARGLLRDIYMTCNLREMPSEYAIRDISNQIEALLTATPAPEVPDHLRDSAKMVEQGERQRDDEERHEEVKEIHDVMAAVPCASLYSLAEAVLDAGYMKADQQGERQDAVAEVVWPPSGIRHGAFKAIDASALGPGTKLYTSPPPAQDVSGLVEALERAARQMWGSEANMDIEAAEIEQALATYRNPATVKRCPTCTGTCAEICAKARP